MTSKKWYALVAVLVIGGTLLAACAQPAPETVVVTKIVEKAGEKVVEEVATAMADALSLHAIGRGNGSCHCNELGGAFRSRIERHCQFR